MDPYEVVIVAEPEPDAVVKVNAKDLSDTPLKQDCYTTINWPSGWELPPSKRPLGGCPLHY